MLIIILLQAALWIWFLGCTVTYRFGRFLLVEGMGVRSAEFAVLCLFSAGIAAFHAFPPAGRWVLAAILLLWLAVQFMCHWYFTLFGASERKLRGYNDSFRGTVRLFPMRDTRLVPDLYHIVLHILIAANLALCAAAACAPV